MSWLWQPLPLAQGVAEAGDTAYSSSGLATVAFTGAAFFDGVLTDVGLASVAFDITLLLDGEFVSNGLATVAWDGQAYIGGPMAVRPLTVVYDREQGHALVSWAGLLNGDTGQDFDARGWLISTVQWRGTPGVGLSAVMTASEEMPGVAYNTLAETGTATTGGTYFHVSGGCQHSLVRPTIAAGDGATNMNCFMLCQKIQR